MILILYSLLSAILIGESILLGWEAWMIFIIIFAVLECWFMHLQNILTSYQRLWVYSILMMITAVFYGTHLTSTYDLAGVIIAIIVLFTLTGISALITLWQVTYFFILVYDLVGTEAGKSFDNVFVIDSGHLSSGPGSFGLFFMTQD